MLALLQLCKGTRLLALFHTVCPNKDVSVVKTVLYIVVSIVTPVCTTRDGSIVTTVCTNIQVDISVVTH